MGEEKEYEIEKIVDKRKRGGKVQYLVEWKDFDEPSWEPKENLGKELIDDYEEEYGDEAYDPKNTDKRPAKDSGDEKPAKKSKDTKTNSKRKSKYSEDESDYENE